MLQSPFLDLQGGNRGAFLVPFLRPWSIISSGGFLQPSAGRPFSYVCMLSDSYFVGFLCRQGTGFFSAFTPPFLRRAWLHTLTWMDDQNQTFVRSGFREPCGYNKQELFALYSCPTISVKARTPLVCEAQNIYMSVFCARKYYPWVFILPETIKWNCSICCKEFCEIVHSSWSEDCWRRVCYWNGRQSGILMCYLSDHPTNIMERVWNYIFHWTEMSGSGFDYFFSPGFCLRMDCWKFV